MTYRNQGREGWPFDPATRDDGGVPQPPRGGAQTRRADKQARIDEYCRLRDKGVPSEEAGARVGVMEKATREYENVWKARRDGTP